jgi:predicted nucleotidyltransferase
MEEKLTTYIKEKYQPRAIVLHGSRASGNARAHSDWDFAILVDEKVEGDREIINGENIEVRVLVLPFKEEEIESRWIVLREGNCKTLFDPEKITESIIAAVTEYYKKPMVFSKAEVIGHKAWFRSHVDGMIDYRDEPEAFFRKLGELYTRCISYWHHFLRHTYMGQVYISLPKIKKEDPEYYALIQVLASNATNDEKINAAEEIYNRLFPAIY